MAARPPRRAGGLEPQYRRINLTGATRWTVRRMEGADDQTAREVPLWRGLAREDNGATECHRAWQSQSSPDRHIVVPAVMSRRAHGDPGWGHRFRRIVMCVRRGCGLVESERTGGGNTGKRAGNHRTWHNDQCHDYHAGYALPPGHGSTIAPLPSILQHFARWPPPPDRCWQEVLRAPEIFPAERPVDVQIWKNSQAMKRTCLLLGRVDWGFLTTCLGTIRASD